MLSMKLFDFTSGHGSPSTTDYNGAEKRRTATSLVDRARIEPLDDVRFTVNRGAL